MSYLRAHARIQEVRDGDGRQNTDDGDNDKQLDERESVWAVYDALSSQWDRCPNDLPVYRTQYILFRGD